MVAGFAEVAERKEILVAGGRFELTTLGLWARTRARSVECLKNSEFFPKSFPRAEWVQDTKGEQICRMLHDKRVHCFRHPQADEQLIEQARLLAKSQHKTLNAMFREWLEQFTDEAAAPMSSTL
jgi:hypothetical protein